MHNKQQTIEDENLVEIIQHYANLPEQVIKGSPLPTLIDGQVETDVLTTMWSYFIQHGYIEFTEPIVTNKMVDLNYREETLARLEAESH